MNDDHKVSLVMALVWFLVWFFGGFTMGALITEFCILVGKLA